MTEIHDTTAAPEVDDFDVEGHGLREVAIGVSAATLLASGSAAALSANADPLERTKQAAGGLVSAAQEDVRELSADALGTVGEVATTAGSEVGRTQTAANRAVGSTTTTANKAVADTTAAARKALVDTARLADSAVTKVGNTTRPVLADPVGWSDAEVDRTVAQTRSVRDKAVTVAGSTVATAQKTVAEAPATVKATATETVTTVVKTAGVSADAQIKDGVSASVGAAGHTVTVAVD